MKNDIFGIIMTIILVISIFILGIIVRNQLNYMEAHKITSQQVDYIYELLIDKDIKDIDLLPIK